MVPIIATKIWHNTPLAQFMTAYKLRVTLVPLLDVLMLLALQHGKPNSTIGLAGFWSLIVLSTACSAIVNSMQFNAQMSFFAKRVDPAIGGSYMTLLNTAANLGTFLFRMVDTACNNIRREIQCMCMFLFSIAYSFFRRYMAGFFRDVACGCLIEGSKVHGRCHS